MHTMTKLLLAGSCCLVAFFVNAQNTPGSNLTSKVALIHLKISRQGEIYSISVKDVTVINDEKKKPLPPQDQANHNGLVCFILDKSNAIIDSIIVKEPLTRRYEYPREDGTIGSKETVLNEKDVMIRSMYNPRMEYLRILKVTGQTKRQSLVTLKLPAPKM